MVEDLSTCENSDCPMAVVYSEINLSVSRTFTCVLRIEKNNEEREDERERTREREK